MVSHPDLVLCTGTPDETRAVAAAVATLQQPGDVVSLTGELGAGKTCFVQGAARALGIRGPVTSPTFTLVRHYDGPLPVVHCDVYRLDRLQDVLDLGDEVLAPDVVTLVEWGDAIAALLPDDRLEVVLELAVDGEADSSTSAPHVWGDSDADVDPPRRISLRGRGSWSSRLADLPPTCRRFRARRWTVSPSVLRTRRGLSGSSFTWRREARPLGRSLKVEPQPSRRAVPFPRARMRSCSSWSRRARRWTCAGCLNGKRGTRAWARSAPLPVQRQDRVVRRRVGQLLGGAQFLRELLARARADDAARGVAEGRMYPWGDTNPNPKLAVYGLESGSAAVCTTERNYFGLCDIIGNVWEWTTDWYQPKHPHDEIKACCSEEPTRPACRGQLRSRSAVDQDSSQGPQGWLTSVCSELLPSISPRCAVP